MLAREARELALLGLRPRDVAEALRLSEAAVVALLVEVHP
jgi:predicted transcriptional regulator